MGQNVLITGTGRKQALGYNLVLRYLEQGEIVFAGVRNPSEALSALQAEYPKSLHILTMDIGSTASVEAAAELVATKVPCVDLLINNAVIVSPDYDKTLEQANLDYIAGVVRTEGGPGRRIEYLKSQALLVRTYLYRHSDRHIIDGYNLCDNTHCQAFNGVTSDSLILRAASETRDQVILAADSSLIISAFHSNCGGETSTSDFVWLSGHAYLKKVTDPYCIKSPNTHWKKGLDAQRPNTHCRYSFPAMTSAFAHGKRAWHAPS